MGTAKKYSSEDLKICDMCKNYEVSPGGCVEKCDALRENDCGGFNTLGNYYVSLRFNGEKNNCKEFKRALTKKELLNYLNA